MIAHEQNLRDFFAGLASIGLISRIVSLNDADPNHFAAMSYRFADAMLRARGDTDEEPESIGGTDD